MLKIGDYGKMTDYFFPYYSEGSITRIESINETAIKIRNKFGNTTWTSSNDFRKLNFFEKLFINKFQDMYLDEK
jgi:hypothetical protein